MLVAGHLKIVMYLVRYYAYIILPAKPQHGLKLVPFPHPAGRIVRRAEQEHLHVLCFEFIFKIVNIYAVNSVFVYKLVRYLPAALVGYGVGKRKIHGRLYKHAVALLGKQRYQPVEARHNARGVAQPFALYLVAVALALPAYERIIIAIRSKLIAERAEIGFLNKRLPYAACAGKVHVRYP